MYFLLKLMDTGLGHICEPAMKDCWQGSITICVLGISQASMTARGPDEVVHSSHCVSILGGAIGDEDSS